MSENCWKVVIFEFVRGRIKRKIWELWISTFSKDRELLGFKIEQRT
jgi:hypothetical protein